LKVGPAVNTAVAKANATVVVATDIVRQLLI
jgi:hypothetical protein